MGTSRACISNSIAQNYSDGEEKSRDPVGTREPSGVLTDGFLGTVTQKLFLGFSLSILFSFISSFVTGVLVCLPPTLFFLL